MSLAAAYIRTDTEGGLPTQEDQLAAIESFAAQHGHDLIARYEDLGAPGTLLYHKPGLREAINNIKEREEWEVLIVADPRCVSEDETAVHELVHKFSLYNNRLECPTRSWEKSLAAMRSYRRAMSRR